jgi:hypothetical protein
MLGISFTLSIIGCDRGSGDHIATSMARNDNSQDQIHHPDFPRISDLQYSPEWATASDDRKRDLVGRAVADRLKGHHAHVTSASWLLIISSPEFDEYAAHRIINDLSEIADKAGYTEIDVEELQPEGTVCQDEWERTVVCQPVFTWKHRVNEPSIPSLK